jgi:hypothetical protein
MEKKKIKKLIFPALAMSIFIPLITMASSDDSVLSAKKFLAERGERRGGPEMSGQRPVDFPDFANLSEEEKATLQIEMEAKNAERQAEREKMASMTEEERASLRAQHQAERLAMQTAIEAGDYNAWLTLAQDKNCPFIDEVTEENFVEFFANHPEPMKGQMNTGRGPGRGNGQGQGRGMIIE